jgi:CHAT domain-containing protein
VSSRLKSTAQRSASSAAISDDALANLFCGDINTAIDRLEEAFAAAPRDGAIASDLAAALAERARLQGNTEDLLRALEMAELAVAKAPDLPEAHFNLALTLERLSLGNQASKTWSRYLDLDHDSDSPWAREAHSHLKVLAHRSGVSAWRKDRRNLVLAALTGKTLEVRRLVEAYPYFARTYAEDHLLGRWAEAWHSGDRAKAQRIIRVVESIARALGSYRGDHLLEDTVAAISAAQSQSPERLALLVEGHRRAAEGVRLEEVRLFAKAAVHFEAALEAFQAGKTPFARWALNHLATCLYYKPNFERALLLAEAAEAGETSRYPSVVGRSRWLTGLALFSMGRLADSLGAYQEALGIYERLGEAPNIGFLHVTVAVNLRRLGDAVGAWGHYLNALPSLDQLEQPTRIYTVLWETADAAGAANHPGLALVCLDEFLTRLADSMGPETIAEALAFRATFQAQLGSREQAKEGLARARAMLKNIPDRNLANRIQSDIQLWEGQVLLGQDDRRAEQLFTEALEYFKRADFLAESVRVRRDRAEARRRLGDLRGAEEDLRVGIEEFERTRLSFPDESHRIEYLAQIHKLFEQMILLQARELQDSQTALLYSEQSRARASVGQEDLKRQSQGLFTHVSAHIPKDTAVIEFAVADTKILIWEILHDKVCFSFSPTSALYARKLSARLLHDLERGDEDDEAAGRLYDALFRPLRCHGADVHKLFIVPDDFLWYVPFSALKESKSNRLMLERYSIALLPSYARLMGKPTLLRHSDGSASTLFVQADFFDRDKFPSLPGMATREGSQSILSDSLVLEGSRATRSRILKELRRVKRFIFAGHAVRLSNGESVLLTAPDKKGDLISQIDIESMQLRNIDLVILGACSTSTGVNKPGEGTMSLARSFLSAGAAEVIGSLWEITDKDANRFLAVLIDELNRGVDTANAVRDTQLVMIRDGCSISGWSAFNLYGTYY